MADRRTRVTRRRAGVFLSSVVVVVAVGAYAAVGDYNDPDTKNPVVRIAAVSNPLEDTVDLEAVCKDNVACTAVTFKLDGEVLGQDTMAPFEYAWDTTTANDGDHTLTASAIDAAANTATSSGRPVDVSNGRANEWVNVTAGASPSRCDTACAYDSTHAYGSFNAAAAAAEADDLVLVRDGTYGAQTVSSSPTGTDAITIRSNNGEAYVTTGSLTASTSYVTLDGFTTADDDPTGDTGYGLTNLSAYDDTGGNPRTETHITFKNIDTHVLYVGTDFVTVQNVTVGPTHACNIVDIGGQEDGVLISAQVAEQGSAHDISFDNLTVHDVDRWQDGVEAHGICTTLGGPHTDGMQVFSADGMTLENSHFYRNATSNILARPCCNGVPVIDNWVIQNNEFGPTLEGGNGVLIGASGEDCNGDNDFLVQNNTFFDSGLRAGCAGTPTVARGNLFGEVYVCSTVERNATYTYNVFRSGSEASCTGSSHAKTCTATYADPLHTDGNYDTAVSDTCARDAADPTAGHFPALDIHGVERPIGSAPDAGANEAG